MLNEGWDAASDSFGISHDIKWCETRWGYLGITVQFV